MSATLGVPCGIAGESEPIGGVDAGR